MRLPDSVVLCQRADAAARLAAESRLPNVRDNLLKAEQSWREMAVRAADLEDRAAFRATKAPDVATDVAPPVIPLPSKANS